MTTLSEYRAELRASIDALIEGINREAEANPAADQLNVLRSYEHETVAELPAYLHRDLGARLTWLRRHIHACRQTIDDIRSDIEVCQARLRLAALDPEYPPCQQVDRAYWNDSLRRRADQLVYWLDSLHGWAQSAAGIETRLMAELKLAEEGL